MALPYLRHFSANLTGYPCRSPHMQPCGDGHCVAVYFFCDGKNDCGDWTDEMNCTGTVSILVLNILIIIVDLNILSYLGIANINHELPT